MTTARRVIVVGGGPAGLTAAAELARPGDLDVLVLERETAAGGIPRHSDHAGYGIRDLHRVVSGPEYAQRLVARAERAGARIETAAMVTGWDETGRLEVTSPAGRRALAADVVVLATGARERPRAARLIPGDRPSGVFTTGHLQNLVHLHGVAVGQRAVVVGSELVSWSAVLTLRHAGCSIALMTTEQPRVEAYRAFALAGRFGLRVPVARRTRLVGILGRPRVRAVEVEDVDTGARRLVECDTVVFTGDWIPDHELARTAGIELDPATRGPLVDAAQRTSRPAVLAAGNLIHPVDTADVAALSGRHVAAGVRTVLAGRPEPAGGVRLNVAAPLRWVTPGLWRPGDAPSRNRLVLWTDAYRGRPRVVARQDGSVVGTIRTAWPAAPGRAFHVPARILDRVDGGGGPVVIGIE